MIHDALVLGYFDGDLIPVVAIGGGMALGALSIMARLIRGISRTKHFEESRREIAAYVAEGSIAPEDAKSLIEAGEGATGPRSCRSC